MRALDWMDDASCRDHDPEIWFPTTEHERAAYGAEDPGVTKARAICRSCPVRGECLLYAMNELEKGLPSKYRSGIYAGLTNIQRAELERQNAA